MEAVRKLCLLAHTCPISMLVFQFRLSPLSFYDKIPSMNNSWGVPTIRLFKKWWGAAVMKACLALLRLSVSRMLVSSLALGSHERISLSPNDGAALREKRGENKNEACGAGVWKTGTTETPHHQLHHYHHPHQPRLGAVTDGFSCQSSGKISRPPVWARSPLIIDGAYSGAL